MPFKISVSVEFIFLLSGRTIFGFIKLLLRKLKNLIIPNIKKKFVDSGKIVLCRQFFKNTTNEMFSQKYIYIFLGLFERLMRSFIIFIIEYNVFEYQPKYKVRR